MEISEIGAETAETSSSTEMHEDGPQRRILQITMAHHAKWMKS
jgi:hypothetical protein